MSLQSRLASLITAIGADVKELQNANIVSLRQGYVLPKDGTAIFHEVVGNNSVTGAATAAPAKAITNAQTRARKVEILATVAVTTAIAGYRSAIAHLLRGNAAGVGGFRSVQTWGPATGASVTTTRAFVGLTALTSAPTDVQPSTLVNCIGMGWDSADTNIQLMHNDASGTCTKVDLGSDFPVPTVDRTDWYTVDIWCSANESKLNYKVTNHNNGAVVTGDTGVSTDIPANTTFLAERGWHSVGGTSSIVGFTFGGYYFQDGT